MSVAALCAPVSVAALCAPVSVAALSTPVAALAAADVVASSLGAASAAAVAGAVGAAVATIPAGYGIQLGAGSTPAGRSLNLRVTYLLSRPNNPRRQQRLRQKLTVINVDGTRTKSRSASAPQSSLAQQLRQLRHVGRDSPRRFAIPSQITKLFRN